MAVVNTYKPASGEFDNTITITDRGGSFVNETNANGAETKPLFSDVVRFVGTGDDKTNKLSTSASNTPPGVSGVDEGSGVLHLEGTPSNSIIPTYNFASAYEKNGGPISTGTDTVPSTYTPGQQVNIYRKYDVDVTSTDKASLTITVPCYIIKDWNGERQALLDHLNETYPE